MKTSTKVVLAFLTIAAIALPSSAKKACPTEFEKCVHCAQLEYKQGDYKKAESLLEHSLGVVQRCHASDEELANALKRLGETFLKLGKYAEAEICFVHAKDLFETINHPDAELLHDMLMLTQAYKSIDVDTLGQFAQELTQEAKVLSVGFLKNRDGDRVEIELANSFYKPIQNPFVHAIELNRHVRFDVVQQSDGEIQINDIKGLQVRKNHWVNVTDLTFKPEDDGLHVASITAKRMGITHTVRAKLSARMYQVISAIAGQVKNRSQSGTTHSLADKTKSSPSGIDADPMQMTPPKPTAAASENNRSSNP